MTNWSELHAREKPSGLPAATRRQIAAGVFRYSFEHDDLMIDDPAVDVTGRFFVSPREYGFAIRGFQGGKTAWARDFANGTMLVVNAEGLSHVLSPKVPARILFVAADGSELQDTGLEGKAQPKIRDLAQLRISMDVQVDLQGELLEAARLTLMRMLERGIRGGVQDGEAQVSVVKFAFDSRVRETPGRSSRSADTDFSQLLDL